jgi:hypothetical protein
MPFQPINEDHAIHNAAFGITLSRAIAWSSVSSLVKSPLDWRRDLPAIELSQFVDVQLNPQTGQPVNRLVRGVEFSHKRPDGSASWQLDVLGTEIKVATSLYTRWEPTWAKAGNILLEVAGQLANVDGEQGQTVTAIAMTVTDIFWTEDIEPDYSELFNPATDHISHAVLRSGRLWHSHSGWFVGRPEGRVLNQLNVDARTGTDDSSIPGLPDDRTRVVIQHNQVYRPTIPIPFPANAVQDVTLFEVPLMHAQNKSMLREILSPSMQERIKVNA